ncbi:MAG: complex I NDUFA9 subunit family protein [Candidatus Competibacterales bacterium]
MAKIQTVGVLGGTGFIGRCLVAKLSEAGLTVKVLTRHRERHRAMLLIPKVSLVEADVYRADALQRHLRGCQAAINLTGILNGRPAQFEAVHAQLPRQLGQACKALGIGRLLHMSALNASVDGPSDYLRTKGLGEQAVLALQEEGVAVTCFRPSVVFGPEDGFFNLFASLMAISPMVPLAKPQTRFAPVFVDDVAEAMARALLRADMAGQCLELCGPKVYTFKELVATIGRLSGRRRLIVGLPDGLAKLQAMVFERLPGQLLTSDNLKSLALDSVCQQNGFEALGIIPVSAETIMGQHFDKGDQRHERYQRFRQSSRR